MSIAQTLENRGSFCYSGRVFVNTCPGVETGRHLSLRWISPQGRGGSSPLPGTNTELRGSERANAWACRRHAHCVSPEFSPESARESAKKESESGALARTCFSPRRRFEIRSNFDCYIHTKRIFVVEIFLLY